MRRTQFAQLFVITLLFCLSSALIACTEDDTKETAADATVDGSTDTSGDGSAGMEDGSTGSATGQDATADTATEPDPFPADCVATDLEADLGASPLAGVIVNPETGEVTMPEDGSEVLVAMTYLRLQGTEASSARFDEVMGGILGSLGQSEGLLASSLAVSDRCGTARTMTVWKDQASMMAFVISDAHSAAMSAVSEISRGGSITQHFQTSSAADIDWAAAAAKFVDHNGPQY